MASKTATVKVVGNGAAAAVNLFAEATLASKTATATADTQRPIIIATAREMQGEDKSLQLATENHVVEVSFKESLALDQQSDGFAALVEAMRNGGVSCVAKSVNVCLRPDKAVEIIALLRSLGRGDCVEERPVYTFDRKAFDALDAEKDAAQIATVRAALTVKTTEQITVKK